MSFELNKCYRNVLGDVVKVIAEADTARCGPSMIGERVEGELIYLGNHAFGDDNWEEIEQHVFDGYVKAYA